MGPAERMFHERIHQYNAALTFTSVSYTADTLMANHGSSTCFQIYSKLHHHMVYLKQLQDSHHDMLN